MRFYHGSLTDNIEELSTQYSNGKICFTLSRLVALTYLSKAYPNMFRSDKNVEVYDEIVDGLLESVTKGQSGFIYIIETDDFCEIAHGPACGHNHCFYSTRNAKVVKKEKIDDLYKELLKYIQSGEFVVVKPDEQRRKIMIENILNNYEKLEKPLKNKRDFMYLLEK